MARLADIEKISDCVGLVGMLRRLLGYGVASPVQSPRMGKVRMY